MAKSKTITPKQISQNNQMLIYQYIRHNPFVSQQDISYALHLSRPTVTAKLSELENAGLIEKSGLIDSELAGRKAAAYRIVSDYKVSIGVEFHSKEVKLVSVNLKGEYTKRVVNKLVFENSDKYIEKLCGVISDFIKSLDLEQDRILGVGIAAPGLVSPDGRTITYGKILDCTGMSIELFEKRLPFPCRFFHDSESAAVSELWVSPELKDACYMSLSMHLGGAFISDRRIPSGLHGHNSTFEHLQLDPNGKPCYCGKRGCAETLCSLSALLNENEDLDPFFEKVRAGEKRALNRWKKFLKNLARLINEVHLLNDTNYILGGYLAPYLIEEDLEFLYQEVRGLTPFPEEEDFIHISKMPKHNITIGAAIPYIIDFLHQGEL